MGEEKGKNINNSIIAVQNVSKIYPGGVKGVLNVNFDIPKGQICGFLGPNGAGKTTTMRIITGYMPPSTGKVTIGGYDIFSDPIDARRQIGYLPEQPPLYPDMNTTEYLEFVAVIKGVERGEIEKRIDYVIDKCSLADVSKRLLAHLSKGYRQRVGIAQALIHDPEILVLDEPTIGLDPKQIRQIRELIKSLKGKHTIILSSHILPEISMICDRALVIHKGEIVADDTLVNLAGLKLAEKRLYIRLGKPGEDVMERLKKIDGVISVKGEDQPGSFTVTVDPDVEVGANISLEILSQGWELEELSHPKQDLEEAFVRLTTG